ncbi:MAG: RHS repeat-associated core domain-containing protein, partial [Acidimicrobiales bacterium]
MIGLATPSGMARAKYSYTPYGTESARALNGTLPSNPYGFDGGYTDSTGLVHFGARYYDPATGSWTQPDASDANYVFCDDDPLNCRDTAGLSGGESAQPAADIECAN